VSLTAITLPAVILHIRYRWKYLLLSVLDNDWHFFLSMYDMGRASGMYGGKEKCMLGFSRETSTKERPRYR